MTTARRRHRHRAKSPQDEPDRPWSANRAREAQWNRYFRNSLFIAALFHVGLFALWRQEDRARDFIELTAATQLIALAPAAEIQMPAEVAAPRVKLPTIESPREEAEAPDLDLELESWLPEEDLLPEFYEQQTFQIPPPTIRDESRDLSRFVRYGQNMSRPMISNMQEVQIFLRSNYTPLAEATGLRGEVLVYFWIDELGDVEKALVYNTSGSIALDALAVELTDIVRFRPAKHQGSPVAVRVMMPIVFSAT